MKKESYFTKLKRRIKERSEDAFIEPVLIVLGIVILWILITKVI
jgi:hypothetical protein